jgi:hypothetical protein
MFFMLLTAVVVTGCASYPVEDVNLLIAQGRCADAANLVKAKTDWYGPRYYELGRVAQTCEKNPQKGMNYLTYSASLGYQDAIDFFIQNNLPVPPISASRTSDPDSGSAALHLINSAVQGYTQGQANQTPPPTISQPNPKVTCTSRKSALSGTVTTTCQ